MLGQRVVVVLVFLWCVLFLTAPFGIVHRNEWTRDRPCNAAIGPAHISSIRCNQCTICTWLHQRQESIGQPCGAYGIDPIFWCCCFALSSLARAIHSQARRKKQLNNSFSMKMYRGIRCTWQFMFACFEIIEIWMKTRNMPNLITAPRPFSCR